MRDAIILLQGGKPISEFPLEGISSLVIGRSSQCDVQVRDSKLSRRHCEIRLGPGGYTVRDLGSKNGTFVNGARVAEAKLGHGDRVQIGLTQLLLHCEQAPPAESTEAAPPQLCAACGNIVPADELSKGRQTASRIYCRECVAAEPLVGLTIGGYEVVQAIGRGGMGTVFKAEQLSMSRPVALKILHPELTTDPEAVQRFLREARAGGQLSHPNIIRIYDMNHAEGHHFISMEFVPGGDVGALLDREGPLPTRHAVDIARQTCRAVAHAHAKGVIHRDIKPTNLLLGRGDLIKVADLGLAKSLDDAGISSLTTTGTALGTLAYVPPEQLVDARQVDGRADVYSIGATCYHLLTGVPPFRGDSAADVARAVRSAPLRPPRAYRRDLPQPVEDLLLRAMARDRDDRFQTADELLQAVEALRL